MLKKVRETLKLIGIKDGDTILVACSGGPDSVALLMALHQLGQGPLGLRLSVTHYDHGLRGNESKRDALFVKNLAKTLGVPFYMGTGDVAAHAKGKRITIQEAARELRYAFLRDIREKNGLKWIATAHTLDDQAEEVLLRLIRGTSLSGLAGIPIKTHDMIIRPLLNIEKDEILEFLRGIGQHFCEDSSNLTSKYTRNRIRHSVIPMLKEINPSFLKAICRTTQILSDDVAYLDLMAQDAFQKALISQEEHVVEFSVQKLNEYHSSILRRTIKSAINHIEPRILRSLRLDHIDAVLNLIRSGKTSHEVVLPQGIIVRRTYNRLSFKRKDRDDLYQRKIDGRAGDKATRTIKKAEPPCRLNLSNPMGTLTMTYKQVSQTRLRQKKPIKKLYLDADTLNYPLTVRCRVKGERFWPLGSPKPYKLKDFLIGRKIPRHVRKYIPLVLSNDQVVAVAGIEVSEPFKITSKTQKVVEITWEPAKELKRELSLMNINIGTGIKS